MRIKVFLLAGIVLLAALWLFADTLVPQPFTYFNFRDAFVQFTGVLAIGCMSLALLLALRPRWLEPHLDGLDKMYRLHKWLGISVLVASVLHWWFAQGTRWMLRWGWLAPRARGGGGAQPHPGAVEAFLGSQRGLAQSLGQWAFYLAAALLVLALVKRFPYRLFARTHVLLAPAYLVLAWHTLVLARFAYWKQPVGWVLVVLLATGSVASLIALFGRIGAACKTQGTIETVQHYPALDVVEARVALEPGWPGHAAGQFAFVCSDRREGAHPYTMASAWTPPENHVTFVAKALGDHTRRLKHWLKPGMRVTVEGPYGCFHFDDGLPRQIWVGAGVGIVPFVARMKQLATERHAEAIDLFHPTSVHEPPAMAKLTAYAKAAGVRLHVAVSGQDRRLDGDRIRSEVPDWREASIWFCGPRAFGESLRADFIAHGLPAARFHQELFEMR